MTPLGIIAFIGVPLFIALCGAAYGLIRGIVRFAQYLVHTEEALDKISASNAEIRDEVRGYKTDTDERFERVDEKLNDHDRRLFHVERVVRD